MVNISKRQIKKKVLLTISNDLFRYIVNVRTSADADKFLSALLTPAERLMLAKRFAAIFMLERGYSYGVIAKTLKISQTTIAKIENNKKEGVYDFIVRHIPKKPAVVGKKSSFWSDLEQFLLVGGIMPPMGRGRWRNVYKMTE